MPRAGGSSSRDISDQSSRGKVSPSVLCAAVTFSAALLVYLNTLPAGFAFDDNFAVGRDAGLEARGVA